MEEPDISDTASSGQDQEEVSQAFAARSPLHTMLQPCWKSGMTVQTFIMVSTNRKTDGIAYAAKCSIGSACRLNKLLTLSWPSMYKMMAHHRWKRTSCQKLHA